MPVDELTPQQDKAILALLSCKTHRQAAAKAGVSHQTLYTWLDDPAFQRHLSAARRRLVGQAVNQLAQVATDAVDALRRNLKAKGNPGVQVRAAVGLLDQLVKVGAVADLAAEVDLLRDELRRINADAGRGDEGTGCDAARGEASDRDADTDPRPTPGGPDATDDGGGADARPLASGTAPLDRPPDRGPLYPPVGEDADGGGFGGGPLVD